MAFASSTEKHREVFSGVELSFIDLTLIECWSQHIIRRNPRWIATQKKDITAYLKLTPFFSGNAAQGNSCERRFVYLALF
jgi:hypothetical protein